MSLEIKLQAVPSGKLQIPLSNPYFSIVIFLQQLILIQYISSVETGA